MGPKKIYIIDIPRVQVQDQDIDGMSSVLESVKNGHLKSFMFGNFKGLLMVSPHVVVFSNSLPNPTHYSNDRIKLYEIVSRNDPDFLDPSDVKPMSMQRWTE